MKLEAGKSYRTKDGRKVTLREHVNDAWPFTSNWADFWSDGEGKASHAFAGQSYSHKYGGKGDGANIVAEWTDGPVRTVTRKEVVFGVFGKVMVNEDPKGGFLNSVAMAPTKDPDELRAAAATLTEIADALDQSDVA